MEADLRFMICRIMNNRLRLQRGFTMIELIIVFALIALLSSYMLGMSFIGAKKRARDSERKTQIKQLSVALEQYVNDHGSYPASSADGEIMGCDSNGDDVYDELCDWGGIFGASGGVIYMAQLPKDKLSSNRRFFYQSNSIGWQLFARLEDDRDPVLDYNENGDYDEGGEGLPAYAICDPGVTGLDTCNYGASSGNVTIFESI